MGSKRKEDRNGITSSWCYNTTALSGKSCRCIKHQRNVFLRNWFWRDSNSWRNCQRRPANGMLPSWEYYASCAVCNTLSSKVSSLCHCSGFEEVGAPDVSFVFGREAANSGVWHWDVSCSSDELLWGNAMARWGMLLGKKLNSRVVSNFGDKSKRVEK